MRKSMSNSFLVGFLVLLLQCTRLHAWDPHGFRGLEEANENETAAPTASNATISPTNLTSLAPTIAPTNATENVTTASPTLAPTAANTSQPTKSPTPGTPAPTASPATNSPTPAPTSSPSGAGTPSPAGQHKGISFLRFVEKTIAYLILLVLALLGFGGTCLFFQSNFIVICRASFTACFSCETFFHCEFI